MSAAPLFIPILCGSYRTVGSSMGKVLVVEDDFDTLHPLAELLRLKGHSVLTAVDAEQGLKIAAQQPLDVIITDIALPGKSGLHFINKLRRDPRLKSAPIIVISGCGPAVLVEAEAAGANFCIEKPISLDAFWEAMDQSLESETGEAQSSQQNLMAGPQEQLTATIDRLVASLRSCNTRAERDETLKELKKCILELHNRSDRTS